MRNGFAPRPSLEGDKGANSARFRARLGPRFPCFSTRLGCSVCPPFPGAAGEEVVSGFGKGKRVSADRKASLGGSGGGEGKNALDIG